MIATLILIAGGLILIVGAGWAGVAVGALLLGVAVWRLTAGRRARHDNTPVTRAELDNPHRFTLRRNNGRWWVWCHCGCAWGGYRTRARAKREGRLHALVWHEAHAPEWMYRQGVR